MTPGTGAFLGVTYATATNLPDLDSEIDEQIDAFIVLSFGRSVNHVQTARLTIQFFDKTPPQEKRKLSWFGKAPSPPKLRPVVWESWDISVQCLPFESENSARAISSSHLLEEKAARHYQSQAIEKSVASFELALLSIIDIVDTYKDHIPPITLLESAPFSYRIRGAGSSLAPESDDKDNTEGWGTYIKKMLD